MTLNLHWAWMLAGLSIVFAHQVGRKLHPSIDLLVAILLIGAAMGETQEALYSGFIVAIIAAVFAMMDDRQYWRVDISVCAIGVLSTFITFGQLALPAALREGISSYPSINGCTIAFTLPLVMYQLRMMDRWANWYMVFAVMAIFATVTSVPVGVLIVVVLSGQAIRRPFRMLAICLGICTALFAAGYALDPNNFLDSNGRFGGWHQIFNWWVASGKILFGLGSGAGVVVFGQMQAMHEQSWGLGQWAHNDYLQLAFDSGLVGLSAALVVLYYALKKSWNRPSLFSAICGYAATAFFNMPTHAPIQAVMGASLLWMTHRERP